MRLYLDTSAVVKLIVEEAESSALQAFLADVNDHERFGSWLLHTELLRTVAKAEESVRIQARQILQSLTLISIDAAILEGAASLRAEPYLRTLDAIHLSTALVAGDSLSHIVTYDERMISAAHQLGLQVASPGNSLS